MGNKIDNLKIPIEEIKAIAENGGVVIFFSPGGFGYVSPKNKTYAGSLLEGIKDTLKMWKYRVALINYSRAKNNIWGKIKSAKENLFSFHSESKKLTGLIETITTNFKNIKILLIGYSSGAAFFNEVMKKIKGKDNIYCIQAGTPFFYKRLTSENILFLDNNGKDALANGNIKKLTFIGIIGILKLVLLFKLIRLKISEAFHFKEHEYFWENPEIRLQVESFLKNNFL